MKYNMPTYYPDGTMGYEEVEIPDDAFSRQPAPREYTPLELTQQDITDRELDAIELGQSMTDLELMIMEGYHV